MLSHLKDHPYTIAGPVDKVDEEVKKTFARLRSGIRNPQLRILGDPKLYSFFGPPIASGT